ncbi:CBS domain-containing protein [Salinirubellus salinus]|uniref:CBS domain-containing protein n=1 Tax=Salinirubellus salinus TaxID=1364945 RepID=A0A9E7R0G2_9EURY|nr:CBS domain-containing protein [Salinirubellus salinus]UWM53034.1 CBS domain-containing protein [Salinirubellus salinus]
MNVADAMTPRESLVTVELPGTREDVLAYLQERSFSSVPVVKQTDDGEEFRGLVSRESLIDQPDEDQLAMLVEAVPSVEADDDISELAALMRETGARRVPVVDSRLVGIVTITDVVRAIADGLTDGDTVVGEVRTAAVNSVYVETPLPVAGRELSYAQVPYGVVLDEEGEPCGMLTEVDIIDVARVVEGEAETGDSFADQDDEWMWEGIKAVGSRYTPTRNVEIPSEPVREFMTEDLVTVSAKRTAREAAQLMISHGIEQIPVLEAGDLVGVVVDMDLLEALVDA